MPLLMLSPKLLNFITFFLFLNVFSSSNILKEFNTKLSLTYKTLLSVVILHIFNHFLVFIAVVLPVRLLWSHFNVLLISTASKSQIGHSIILLLLCGAVFIPTYLLHFSFHCTSSQPNLDSLIHLCFLIVLLSFSNDSKLISFTFLFLSHSHSLHYLWTDISGEDLVLLLCFILLSFRYHSSSSHSLFFYVI
jgi:hypothetical protein